MIGSNFKTNLVGQLSDHRSGKSPLRVGTNMTVPASYTMDVLKAHHESQFVSCSGAPRAYFRNALTELVTSTCATAGRIPFNFKVARSPPNYSVMYFYGARTGVCQPAKPFSSLLDAQKADNFCEQPPRLKVSEQFDHRLVIAALACVMNDRTLTEQRNREGQFDQDPSAKRQRSNSCQRQMDRPLTSDLLCPDVYDKVASQLDPRVLSSQSSRVDSALSSGSASTSTSKSTSPTRPTLDRQCSSGSVQSSFKLRVTYIVLLRGRHIPERVRITCRCCLQVARKNRRRKLTSAVDRARARARAPRRDSGSSVDSESTLTDARHFVQTFSYLPESASDDESDSASESAESDSVEASESDDDASSEQESEPWSAESSSEYDSDSDTSGAHEQKPKQSNKSAEFDLELHFGSLGLASIGLHVRATPERTCEKSSEQEQKSSNRCANSYARSQCVVVTVSERTITMDCESDPESWSQKDTRCSPTGISYQYVVVGTPRCRPPVAIELLKRNSSKASDDNDAKTYSGSYDAEQNEPAKKVRFASGSALVRVRPLYTWRFWSQRARQDEYLLRKPHFRRRISESEQLLCRVLSAAHRARVFCDRFDS